MDKFNPAACWSDELGVCRIERGGSSLDTIDEMQVVIDDYFIG